MIARLAMFFVCVCLIVPAAMGQDVEITTDLKVGDSTRYTIGRFIRLSQEPPEGEPINTEVSHVADVVLEVQEVAPNGVATIQMTFQSLVIDFRMPGEIATFRMIAADGGRQMTATNDELKAIGEAMAKSTIEYKVSRSGEVTSITGLQGVMTALEAQESFEGTEAIGFLAEDSLPTMLGPLYAADGAMDATRTVGRGWQNTETVSLPPVAAIDIVTDWQVVSVAEAQQIATMQGDVSFQLRLPPNPAEDTARLSIQEGEGQTRMNWDVEKNELISRIGTQSLTMVWTLGDMSVTQKQSSRMMIVRID